jgi:hypothetical protein
LGVVLYTILTGYRPFQGNSALTVSYKVVNRDPIPATVLETELPQGLDYIISRAMAKDPAQRYQRGMEMALDIQDLREGRELWSKAKQPASVGGGIAPISAEKDKSSPPVRGLAAKARSAQRAKPNAMKDAQSLLDKKTIRYFAGALFLAGLSLFGLRVSHAVWHKQVPGENHPAINVEAPMPILGDAATAKNSPDSPPVAVSTNAPLSTNVPSGAPSEPPAKKVKSAVALSASRVSPKKPAQPSSAPTEAAIPATLDIEVDHKFAQADLSIWVDGQLSYTHTLEGTDKKRLVVFHHVQGHEIHAMQIPSGNHHLRVKISSDANSSDQIVTGDFPGGSEKLLRISFDKRGEMNLNLE